MNPPLVRRAPARRAFVAALLLSASLAARARADSCSDCGPPSDADFRAAMGDRFRDYGDSPDSYEYDGGECSAVVGPVTMKKVREELVSMGVGEAWNCPESKASSHATFTFEMSGENEWHLTGSLGAELDVPILAALKAGVEGGASSSVGSSTTTTISVNIESSFCHRTPWAAYFIVGEFQASAHYDVKRRFRWWIKNPTSGSHVVASGDVYVVCEGGEAVMARVWPILGSVLAGDKRCATGCVKVTTSQKVWHPPLPPGIPPIDPWPVTPDAPEAGGNGTEGGGSEGDGSGGDGGGGDGGTGDDSGMGTDAPPPAPPAPPKPPGIPKPPLDPLTPGGTGTPGAPTDPQNPNAAPGKPNPDDPDDPLDPDGLGDDPLGGDPFGGDPFWDDPFGDDPYGDDLKGRLNPLDGTPTCPVGPDGRAP